MKKYIYLFLASVAIISFSSCEESTVDALGTNFVSFESTSYSTGVDPGGSTTLDVDVYTTNITGSDRIYTITVDGSSAADNSYTVPTSVTVPGGLNKGTFTIALSDTNLGIGINSLGISFEGSTKFYTGKPTEINYVQNCTEVTATLDLSFDRWGSEVYWEILDGLDGVVASTAGYPDTASGTTTTDSVAITLCAGRAYTLYVEDGYGDGWGAGSSYTLTIGGVVKVSGDGSVLTPNGVSTAFDTN